jgi:hypothetical protein
MLSAYYIRKDHKIQQFIALADLYEEPVTIHSSRLVPDSALVGRDKARPTHFLYLKSDKVR